MNWWYVGWAKGALFEGQYKLKTTAPTMKKRMKMGIWMGSTGTGRKIVSESYTDGPEVQSYHPFPIIKT